MAAFAPPQGQSFAPTWQCIFGDRPLHYRRVRGSPVHLQPQTTVQSLVEGGSATCMFVTQEEEKEEKESFWRPYTLSHTHSCMKAAHLWKPASEEEDEEEEKPQ